MSEIWILSIEHKQAYDNVKSTRLKCCLNVSGTSQLIVCFVPIDYNTVFHIRHWYSKVKGMNHAFRRALWRKPLYLSFEARMTAIHFVHINRQFAVRLAFVLANENQAVPFWWDGSDFVRFCLEKHVKWRSLEGTSEWMGRHLLPLPYRRSYSIKSTDEWYANGLKSRNTI